MLIGLIRLVIRSYLRLHFPSLLREIDHDRSRGRSFIYNRTATMVTRRLVGAFGRRELIDVSNIKQGEVIVIEQLPISHRKQIKQFKKAERDAKRAAKQERRAARRG